MDFPYCHFISRALQLVFILNFFFFWKDKMSDSLIETRPPKITRSQSRPSSQIRGDQLLYQYYYLHKYMYLRKK